MSDLVAWLREQFDADERGAKVAEEFYREHGEYIPDGSKRMLAEVESKREILDHIQPIIEHWDECCTPGCQGCRQEWSREKIRLRYRFALLPMAIPYRDRPGYDPTWGEE